MTNQDHDGEVTEADVRALRSTRQLAVIDFVKALGFDPTDVRSLSISSGAITVHTFIKSEGGYATIIDENNRSVKVLKETVLLYHQGDLDAASEFEKFLKGE